MAKRYFLGMYSRKRNDTDVKFPLRMYYQASVEQKPIPVTLESQAEFEKYKQDRHLYAFERGLIGGDAYQQILNRQQAVISSNQFSIINQ